MNETQRKRLQKSGQLKIIFTEKQHKIIPVYFHESTWHILQSIRDLAPFQCEEHSHFNFGFFVRQTLESEEGVFISEDRCVGEILDIFADSPPTVEYMLKRRNNKDHLDIRQVNKINNKVNQKKCFEFVATGQVGKLETLLSGGFDPNFLSEETGESPLTFSASSKAPSNFTDVIMTLVNGGAITHYRNRDGITPMHKAVLDTKRDAVKMLLILGASPSPLDSKFITPLFRACQLSNTREICEILMRERCVVGCSDFNGWSELHHASKAGLVDIMELLIWYGANVNSQNSGGNTPLHICGVHGQEAAAIVLLRRGVNREILNYSNRTPYQVAIISGNKNVAKRIDQHDENEVVKFSDRPSYNPRARPVSQMYQLCVTNKTRKKSIRNPNVSKLKQNDPVSTPNDNLGVSKFGSLKRSMFRTTKKATLERVRVRAVNTGNSYAVTRNYTPQVKEDIALTAGDNIEVLNIGKDGFIEGISNGKQGWFPGTCVELINVNKTAPKKGNSPIYQSLKFKKIKIKRSTKGFCFSVRGATCDLENYHPTPVVPSLQYVAQVDKAGAAERAGLEVGHFILCINGQNVVTMPHNEVVELVRTTKKVLEMTVTRSLQIQKPEVPPRARPVQKMVDTDSTAVRSSDSELGRLREHVAQSGKDSRRVGHVNPLFLLHGAAENITPPDTNVHNYATVHKDGKGELRTQISADEEQVYMYGQKKEVINELQSKSDTFLASKISDDNKLVHIQRNSNRDSIEYSYNNDSSSSNADMKTDSKVSDFTIESGQFYNSQGEIVTSELGLETEITKADSIYVDDEIEANEYSENDQNQFKYEGNYSMFNQRFSNASLENNKADSTFDDEGDFTPYERLSPIEEPPYDTLDRMDLYYSAPYEGEDTYDRLNYGGQYFPSEDTLEGELTGDFDYEQYDQLDRDPVEYEHLQTVEEFYQLVGDSDQQLANEYRRETSEVETANADVIEGKVEEGNVNLSQFAKAVLEKSLNLKTRRSQQTESNSASETGSNLSLKNSDSDKKGESQTSDLGSSTYETENTLQEALPNSLISPTRKLDNLSTQDIPFQNKIRAEEYSYLLDPPNSENENEFPSQSQGICNTQFDLCTIQNESPATIRRLSNSAQLDEQNPQHWKRMLKKVHREKPSKLDEANQFISRQLSSESKSCESIYTQNITSLSPTDNRITYTLQDEQTIAGRIPSIYNEEVSPDYEDNTAYWKGHYNTTRSVTKKSISDSELSKLTGQITSPPEKGSPPKPNYLTFPGDLPQGGPEKEDLTFEPYLDYTPTPLDIQADSPPHSFLYSPGIPSPPPSYVLMPPPEWFDGIDPEMLPPPPDIEKSFNQDNYLPPPPSNLELHTMSNQATQDDVTPPDEILYRMDLKHSRQFKKTAEWSTDEVGEWLESFGMEMYQNAFIDNDIQGSHLGLLDKEDLSALGITKLGHKMTIIKEISKLHF
ncbi:SH3 and multiple ankyrin repeat domains protein 3-like isoform X1 [Oopsacas minuta]|uniref:SH3 and multiple ankyrin repeat domains protein 3-like isoform X1 n=1 Tax=Oopsacas minuta TaxID=111878 RepID=A0AAV7JTH7_9METZ|nr:SH3 and multiple ankyrin repeat domains protein 3-like isoform X1 [Oopsacas minuta]